MLESLLIFAFTGAAAGVLAGLFGVGGGFLLTPLLIFSGVSAPVAVASVTPCHVAIARVSPSAQGCRIAQVCGAALHWLAYFVCSAPRVS
mgnify:CR=1 FL=1